MEDNLFEEELTCPICRRVLNDPVILPCMHHFCSECISTVWDTIRPFRCPVCRKHYRRRPRLQRDFTVANIVTCYENLKERSSINNSAHHAGMKVMEMCLGCNVATCPIHFQQHLDRPCEVPGHLIVKVDEVADWKCSVHDEFKMLYCEDDEVLRCPSCCSSHCSNHKVHIVRVFWKEMLAKLQLLESKLTNSAANITENIQNLESEQRVMRKKMLHLQHLLRVNCHRFCGQKQAILDEYHRQSDLQQREHIEQLNSHCCEVRNLLSSITTCLNGADSISFMRNTRFHQQLIEKSNLILDRSIPQLSKNHLNSDAVMSTIIQKENEICGIMQQMLNGTLTSQTNESDSFATSSTTQSLPLKRKRTNDDAFLENHPGSSTSQDPLAHACKRGRLADQNQNPQTATTSSALGSPQIVDSHRSSDSSLTGSTHETQTQAYSEDIQDSNLGSSTPQEIPSLDPSIPMLVDQDQDPQTATTSSALDGPQINESHSSSDSSLNRSTRLRTTIMEDLSMKEALTCPICQGVFNDAVILPCRHNFCRKCICTVWDTTRPIHCPTCRMHYRKRPRLQRNFTVSNITRYYQSLIADNLMRCVSCQELPGQEVTKVCLVCREECCRLHVQEHLDKPCEAPGHILAKVKELDAWKCSAHDKFKVLYCEDDDILLCLSCFMSYCSDHRVNIISVLQEEMLTKLLLLEGKLAQSAANMAEKIQKLQSEQIAKQKKVFHMQYLLEANCHRFCGQKQTILDEYKEKSDQQQREHIEQLNSHRCEVRNLLSSITTCLNGADSIGFMKHTTFHQQLIKKSNLRMERSVPQLSENHINSDVVMSTLTQKEKEICRIMQQMLNGTLTSQTNESDSFAELHHSKSAIKKEEDN